MKKFLSILAIAASCAATANAADFVACVGRITPKDRVQKLAVHTPTGAQAVVGELKIKAGDIVKKGDIVAVMEGEKAAAAALARARAAVEVAVSSGKIKTADAANSAADIEGELQQISDVLTQKDPPRREREELEYQRTSLLRKLAFAREMAALTKKNADDIVAEAKAALAEAEVAHAACFLKSPISGCVLDTHVKAGEAVSMEGVCEIADTSEIFVEAEVYVADISKVCVGDSAEISCDALGGEKFGGKVVAISGAVKSNRVFSSDPSEYSNLKVVRVKIKLDKPEAFARLIGSQVNVRIATK